MIESVPSYQARLDRAEGHIDLLTREIHGWLDRHTPFPDEEVDQRTGETVVRLRELLDPVPDSWGTTIGDVLHNLRSSLDHLANALTVAHNGEPLDPALERRTEFPICSTEPLFRRYAYKIEGMAPRAKDAIEALQPFQRGADYGLDPLWLLRELSNIDKHRRPTLTALHVEPRVRPEDAAGFELGAPGHVETGERFTLGRYRRDHPDDAKRTGYGYMYDVAFREPLACDPPRVKLILWSIWQHIGGSVIPAVAEFL